MPRWIHTESIACLVTLLSLNVIGEFNGFGAEAWSFGWPFQYGHNAIWDVAAENAAETVPLIFLNDAAIDRPMRLAVNVAVIVVILIGVCLHGANCQPWLTGRVSLATCIAWTTAIGIWLGMLPWT